MTKCDNTTGIQTFSAKIRTQRNAEYYRMLMLHNTVVQVIRRPTSQIAITKRHKLSASSVIAFYTTVRHKEW